tara:strand:- start:603 stop:890 length:288 start_codon:yes stop_codon:yes gene_type:complete
MAITKTTQDDKIEVVDDYKIIHVRTATIIKEDGTELSRTWNRRVIDPGYLDASDNLVDTDISSESAEIKGICNTVWTQAVKDAYKAHLKSNKKPS